MYRTIGDFQSDWKYERDATLKILGALTDEALAQRVNPEGRSIGQLGWHLTLTLGEMLGHSGLAVEAPPQDAPVPALAADLHSAYKEAGDAVAARVGERWTDAMLAEEIAMYGERWPRGKVLSALILHQAHHRGQMTVLMRQAGLTVPGIYGPAREEWSAFGAPAPW